MVTNLAPLKGGGGVPRALHWTEAMVFVLDNYDSFTYNLVQYMGEMGAEMTVRRNDELTVDEVEALAPRPHPALARPLHAAGSRHLHRPHPRFADQSSPSSASVSATRPSAQPSAADVIRAPKLMHGKTSEVEHDGKTIFAGIASPMTCTRYHSLIVSEKRPPADLEVSARTTDGTIMGLRHRKYPVEGVQFHPESVLTSDGKQLIKNFLEL